MTLGDGLERDSGLRSSYDRSGRLYLHGAYYFDEPDDGIDLGFLGLLLLLVTIFYMIAFSFLVAASTKGLDIPRRVGSNFIESL